MEDLPFLRVREKQHVLLQVKVQPAGRRGVGHLGGRSSRALVLAVGHVHLVDGVDVGEVQLHLGRVLLGPALVGP